MVRSQTMETRRRNRKFKRKAASALEVAKILKLKREAMEKAMEAKRKAASAVDVGKILRLKKEAVEAMETKCFPLTAKARLAVAEAGATQPSRAGKEKIPEKKKKKVVVKYPVSQGYIDHLKAGLFYGVDEIPEDELATRSQLFRDGYRAKVLLTEKLRACQQVLLDQYNVFGYAYDAKEVTDDEGEDEGEGEVVVKN